MIETKGTAAQTDPVGSVLSRLLLMQATRREALRYLAALGGLVMVTGGGIVVAETTFPEDETLSSRPLDPKIANQLAQFRGRVITVVHRGGNTLADFLLSYSVRPDFIEADVWGDLTVGHEYPVGSLVLNNDLLYLHRPKPEFTLKELAALAAQRGQPLMLDLKGIYGTALNKVLDIMGQDGLEGSILSSSTDLGALDVLREKIDVVGVNSKRELRAVLQKRDQLKPGARVSLKYDLATWENTAELIRAEIPFWPYDIPNPQATLRALEMGAQGVITNNLAVIAAMSQFRNPDPVAAGIVRSADRWAGQA